jgi:methylmalonyl-CoA/ethylmalonyl-CoA epimerase
VGKNKTEESPFSRTYQVAVVVKDLDKAIKFYESLGIGPFVEGGSASAIERKVYGKPAPDVKIKGAMTQMGQINFELLQPVEGESVQKEFLESRGEGVIHICSWVDDLDKEIAKMAEKGVKVVSYVELSDHGKCAYFDTREVGGFFLELFQAGPNWKC